jgi:hypothetical protein
MRRSEVYIWNPGLSRHRRQSRWTTEDRPKSQGMPSAADQSQWRRDASEFNELNIRDASEFNELNIYLAKGKLL